MSCVHTSAKTLKLLTGEVNEIDHVFAKQCSGGKAVMWMFFDTHHSPKHHYRASTPPHGNNIEHWQDGGVSYQNIAL